MTQAMRRATRELCTGICRGRGPQAFAPTGLVTGLVQCRYCRLIRRAAPEPSAVSHPRPRDLPHGRQQARQDELGAHPSRVWTIGYEGRALPQFLALLREAGIQVVVDVRAHAFRPGSGLLRGAAAADSPRRGHELPASVFTRQSACPTSATRAHWQLSHVLRGVSRVPRRVCAGESNARAARRTGTGASPLSPLPGARPPQVSSLRSGRAAQCPGGPTRRTSLKQRANWRVMRQPARHERMLSHVRDNPLSHRTVYP